MRYWVFTDAQLDAALAAFLKRHKERLAGAGGDRALSVAATELAIRGFLDSPEARAHKLMGGASYEPESAR